MDKTEFSECPVCCDKYTSQLRKPVTCPYCEFSSCTVCSKKYLTEGLMDAHCMGCRRAWNDEFLDMTFTKSFRTGVYRKHREDILMEREISLLPTRQPRVEAQVKMREYQQKQADVNAELREYEVKRAEIMRKSNEIVRHITRYQAESEGRAPPAWTLTPGERGATVEKAKFIMKCPDGECRGFLSTAYKCGTCQLWACSDCLVIKGKEKDSEHTCDPGQKESVALIIKESKGCPKCGERISKIDGCDQMFCVDCHTAFSWNTGQIVNGVIHNPHYYEFLRGQGNGVAPRNAGDVPCGGVPYYAHLQAGVTNISTSSQRTIMNIHRLTAEIADQRIQAYQGQFNMNDNGDLGVMYLLKGITKDAMKCELAKREMKRNKHLAIRAILEMFVNTSTMMLNNIVNSPPGDKHKEKIRQIREKRKEQSNLIAEKRNLIANDPDRKLKNNDAILKEITEIIENDVIIKKELEDLKARAIIEADKEFEPTMLEYTNLRQYVNDSLMGVSRMKNCSVPQIGEEWNWKPFNKVEKTKRVKKTVESESE